jgi:uncharacterized protein with PIN domain
MREWGGPSMNPEDAERYLNPEEAEKPSTIEQLRKEGEAVLTRFYQGVDIATGRKYHPEALRKLLGEYTESVTDVESYRKRTESSAINRALTPVLEVAYGSMSMVVKDSAERMLRAAAKFGKGIGELSERGADKVKDFDYGADNK